MTPFDNQLLQSDQQLLALPVRQGDGWHEFLSLMLLITLRENSIAMTQCRCACCGRPIIYKGYCGIELIIAYGRARTLQAQGISAQAIMKSDPAVAAAVEYFGEKENIEAIAHASKES